MMVQITGKQVIAVLLIFIAVANMILYGMGKVSTLWFWSFIIVVALLTMWIFPRRKHEKGDKDTGNR